MHPTLLHIFGLRFGAYMTMLATAFLVCTLGAVRDLQRRQPPVDATTHGGLWAFVGALLGAKAYWILQYDHPANLWRAVFIWQGGLVFYGGLAGGLLGAWAYAALNRIPKLALADAAAPYLALGEAITRIGCFLNGCCWGAVSNVPWAVAFPRNSPPFRQHVLEGLLDNTASRSMPVHPTQLYMVIALVAVFFALKRLNARSPFPGAAALGYLLAYGVIRFVVESFRGDSARSVAGLTVSQTISGVLAILSISVFLVISLRRRASGTAVQGGGPAEIAQSSAASDAPEEP